MNHILIERVTKVCNEGSYVMVKSYQKFYSFSEDVWHISLQPIDKPSAFCSTDKDSTSQDDHSQRRLEIAQLNWARS